MKKSDEFNKIGAVVLTLALISLLFVSAFGEDYFWDMTYRPVQNGLTHNGSQFSQEIKALTANVDSILLDVNFDVSLDSKTYPYSMSLPLLWGYGNLELSFKARTSSTADIIYRVEGRDIDDDSDLEWYNLNRNSVTIDNTNDSLYVVTRTDSGSVVLTRGTYTASQLADSLETRINAKGIGAGTVTVSYIEADSQTYVISSDTSVISIHSLSDSSNWAPWIFGFNSTTKLDTASTIISQFKVPAKILPNVGTTFVADTLKGYFDLEEGGFDSVPFEIRVPFQCNESNQGIGRVNNDTYIRGFFRHK